MSDVNPCGALLPPLRDYGWECSGRGLIVVTVAGAKRIPVVLPRRALEILDPEDWWDSPVRDFTGGDHMHLCVSRRPTPAFKTDTVISWGMGSVALPVKSLGKTADGGDAFIGFASGGASRDR
jgi:hypothetical protein